MAMTAGAPALPSATSAPASDSVPVEVVCQIAFDERANTRDGAGTEYAVVRAVDPGQTLPAVAQRTDSAGAVWWRLLDRTWVRNDLVRESGDCDSLPTQSHSDPIPGTFGAPDNREGEPTGARLLSGGRGTVNGTTMTEGKMQVEGYCEALGYVTENRLNHWFCTTTGGQEMLRFDPGDFDRICRATYSNPGAFAMQSGTEDRPSFRWRCYAR
jgi:hypothetical protein